MKLFAKWYSKQASKACKAVRETDNQLQLARIAVQARHWEARELAVEKLIAADHQPLLGLIARTDKESRMRAAAMERLDVATNQPLLIEIAQKDTDRKICEAAFQKIFITNDQPRLAALAKANLDFSALEAMVEKLWDIYCLAGVARNASNSDVRKAAIKKLRAEDHQPLLAEIAKKDKDSDVRNMALERLTDQACLADVARNAEDPDIRITATRLHFIKEDHQMLLTEIARTDKDQRVCMNAIQRLVAEDHQLFLADLAQRSRFFSVRTTAVQYLIAADHQPLLAEIAWKDKDYGVRKAAVEKLSDKKLLQKLIARCGRSLKSLFAMKRVYNGWILQHIYETHDDVALRKQIAAYNGTLILHGHAGISEWVEEYNEEGMHIGSHEIVKLHPSRGEYFYVYDPIK
ncbi:MAG: hypothetical protein LBD28_02535 [Tannerellaceae bacterium]|jgi:hypothetical protein|nr:hypothetical protein [Tannerellaceae bacterium]